VSGETVEVEATGETVGEAKWSALRELERRLPGLDRDAVEFVVVAAGERGLLGVGRVPAKVVARTAAAATRMPAPEPPAGDESPAAAELRRLLELVAEALHEPVAVAVAEDAETIRATLTGAGLGLFIGKHGQTIDAIQYLANAIVGRGDEERKEVVVDAAGYRDRRRETLERAADRAAERALASGGPVSLEPMSPVERKIVHVRLHDRADVATSSEGTEPNRYVVVRPV
jgi:spoIIIJ-associated protein